MFDPIEQVDARRFPTLARLIAEGVVGYDEVEGTWYGKAADGIEVQVGHDAESAERYLSHRPDPADW